MIGKIVEDGKRAAEQINRSDPFNAIDVDVYPRNEFALAQLEPGDRFVYDVNISPLTEEAGISHDTLVSIASSVNLSKAEIDAIGLEELVRRVCSSPEAFGVGSEVCEGLGSGSQIIKPAPANFSIDVIFTEAGY